MPPLRVSQADALEFIRRRFSIADRTRALYERILANDAIRFRHFALESLDDVLDTDPDRINQRFERTAPVLGGEALKHALSNAGIPPEKLDYLAAATCTGYLCPGLAPRLI